MTRRGWLLFAAMCVIWGVPYLLIRVAVRDVAPGTLVFLRTGLGGVLLLPWCWRHGGFRQLLPRWAPILAFALVELAIPWLCLSDAERHLSSSVTGILVASVPIVGVVVARVVGLSERTTRIQMLGLLLGITGVALLVGLDLHGLSRLALFELGLVAVGYAVGPVIMSRYLADLPSIPVVAACLLVAATGYLPYAATHWPHNLIPTQILAIATLAIVCTALAFVLFFALIATIGPTRATVIAQVNPAVAVLLGVVFLSEPFTAGMAIGFPLILVGSVLAARAGRVPSPQPTRQESLHPLTDFS
jgi:drug/metabolite transporter (DMT)-like permease